MHLSELLLWIFVFVVFYTYVGYGILIYLLVKIKNLWRKKTPFGPNSFLPPVTLIIPSFNGEDFIREKIENTLKLDYPENLLHIVFVTDGSTDNTPEIVAAYPRFTLLHQPERKGKVAAMNRAMLEVKTEFVIFCDDNTMLNSQSIKYLIRHYQDEKTGGVAGEKKIRKEDNTDGSSSGEGAYWKYESLLKKLDAQLFSVIGAAGELFSIRTRLFEPVPENTLLDDFVLSLRICEKGYRFAYEPDAFAEEKPSFDIREEEKRKIRISTGGFQSMFMMPSLLNPFRHPVLTFQYISHRVFRWAVCPFLLPLILLLNVYIVVAHPQTIYLFLLAGQILFYLTAWIGRTAMTLKKKLKLLTIPYYFVFMNVSVYKGLYRYLAKTQNVLWEKAKRNT